MLKLPGSPLQPGASSVKDKKVLLLYNSMKADDV